MDQSKLDNLEVAITTNRGQQTELTEQLTSVEAQIRPYNEQIDAINARMRALPRPAELRHLSQSDRQKSMNERFALADQKREPIEKRDQPALEKTSLEEKLAGLNEESRSLSMEQRTTQRQFEADRREQQDTWERANNHYQDYLRKKSLQVNWLTILEQLRDTSRTEATTLAPAYNARGEIESIDSRYDGVVPPEYQLKETLLDPRSEQSRRTFDNNECGLYKWGGHDHWAFLIVNKRGEVDRINDSQCTRKKFASKQSMLDHFSQPGRYVEEQLTAVHP